MLVVKNVDSIGGLRVVFDVALMLFVVELEAVAGLANILFIACYTCQ